MIGYSDKATRPLFLIMPKMSGYVKTFKVEETNSILISSNIDNEKLLEKCKAIWNKIEDLKYIKLNDLPVYDNRYIKAETRTYGHKVYTNFHVFNVLEYDVECESFTVISIDSLLVYKSKYYLQVFSDDCAYKIVNKQMKDYLDDNCNNI